MKTIINELKNTEFISSSCLTQQFSNFSRKFKRVFKKELIKLNCSNIEIDRGHFYFSGFFDYKNKVFYFSFSDVRFFKGNPMLLRTAKHHKDYTGGSNCFINLDDNFMDALKSKMEVI